MKNLLILFIVVFVQASCGQSTETTRSAEKFKEEIANPDVILLDVRTPEELRKDHLKNSINLNYNDADFASKVDNLDKKSSTKSIAAAENAVVPEINARKGIKNVHDLQGGILEWEAKGFSGYEVSQKSKLLRSKFSDKNIYYIMRFFCVFCASLREINHA